MDKEICLRFRVDDWKSKKCSKLLDQLLEASTSNTLSYEYDIDCIPEEILDGIKHSVNRYVSKAWEDLREWLRDYYVMREAKEEHGFELINQAFGGHIDLDTKSPHGMTNRPHERVIELLELFLDGKDENHYTDLSESDTKILIKDSIDEQHNT